jgi:hypothetical protein
MLKSSRRDLGLALAALALLCSSPASAQWSGSATAGFGHGLGAISLSQGNLSLSQNALRQRAARQNGGARAPAPRNAGLSYTPDPRLTEKIRVSMIDLASKGNPDSRPQWEKLMADNAMLRDFDNLMASYGYSRLNFADDVAMLLTACWETASGRDASAAQVRGARDQMRGIARTNPALRGMSNEQRQELAESIAYQVLFLYAAKLGADRSGDIAQLAEVRSSAAQAARQYGIDVSQTTLTDRGFRRI